MAQAVDPSVRNVVAGKSITIRGVNYAPGDPVDVSQLPDHKVTQLLNQRVFRPGTPSELVKEY